MSELNCREQMIAREAFIHGRIYANTGEKEDPRAIEEETFKACVMAVKSHPRAAPDDDIQAVVDAARKVDADWKRHLVTSQNPVMNNLSRLSERLLTLDKGE